MKVRSPSSTKLGGGRLRGGGLGAEPPGLGGRGGRRKWIGPVFYPSSPVRSGCPCGLSEGSVPAALISRRVARPKRATSPPARTTADPLAVTTCGCHHRPASSRPTLVVSPFIAWCRLLSQRLPTAPTITQAGLPRDRIESASARQRSAVRISRGGACTTVRRS